MPRAARWITCCALIFVARPVAAEPELGGFARIGVAMTPGPVRATGWMLGVGFAARWPRLELEVGTELDSITSPRGDADGPNIRSMLDVRVGRSLDVGALAARGSVGLGWGTTQVYRNVPAGNGWTYEADFEVTGPHAEVRAGVGFPDGLEISAGAHLPLFRVEAPKSYQDEDAMVWWPTFDLSVGVHLESPRPRHAYLETIVFAELAASAMVWGGFVNLLDRIDDGCHDTCINTRDRDIGWMTAMVGMTALAVSGPVIHGLFHNSRGVAYSVAYRASVALGAWVLGKLDDVGGSALLIGLGATPIIDAAIAGLAAITRGR